MQFGKPDYFWWLLFLPALLLFYWVAFRNRRKALFRFTGPVLASRLLVAASPFKRGLKATLLMLVFLFLILALAQPKWGFEIREVKRQGINLMVAVDVSKSMLAEDVKPSRLARAKLEVTSLLDRLTGDRAGLVAFAGSSFIQCPLTLDYATVKLFLDDLSIQSIPRGGTDIGGAIQKSVEAFKGVGEGERVVILLTDGEDHKGGLEEALALAKKEKVRIYPVGVGRNEGAPIPVEEPGGQERYIRSPEGEVVLSKLNVALLEEVAAATGGKANLLGTRDFTLEELYLREIAKLEKEELASQQKKEYHHRFQWPLAVAIAFFWIEGLLSERRAV